MLRGRAWRTHQVESGKGDAGVQTRTLELIISRRQCFPPNLDIFPIKGNFRKQSI